MIDLQALALTARLAALTTGLLLVIGTPLALWLAGKPSWPRRAVFTLTLLPLLLPPTVLGFYLLWGLGPLTVTGRLLAHILGHSLAFTFPGLVLGSMLYSLPFTVQPLTAAFEGVPRELREIAAVLGASPRQIAMRLTLPLARGAFITAALLTFAHTVGEFGVVLMLGGDIPGVTRTLSIALFDRVEEGNYAAANHMALLLVALSFAALLLLQLRRRPTAL